MTQQQTNEEETMHAGNPADPAQATESAEDWW